jgi:hypothetical protein
VRVEKRFMKARVATSVLLNVVQAVWDVGCISRVDVALWREGRRSRYITRVLCGFFLQ